MSESQRTLIFVGVALVSGVLAWFAGPSAPKPNTEIVGVGELFYPDFKDADAAKSMEVVNYNPDTASVRPFAIVQDKSGLWRIPYAHNYPADGKERLAKTATAMIGIKKETYAGSRESEHADFGVLDPKSDSAADLKGIGNRITLKDGDGKVLADYIIGKEVKGRTGMHYIRRPDDKKTYIAKLDIPVSTKFADWIEADLLKIDAPRLNSITINTDTVDLNQGALIEGETNQLTRKSSTDNWSLPGIDDTKEELNQDEIRKLVSSLDELKIVGVRRKPAALIKGQLDQITQLDLQTKGFYPQPTRKPGGVRLVPKDGNVVAVTDQGVAYELKFGEIFSGTDEEVEVGFAAKEEGKDDKKDKEKKKEEPKSSQKSRYLMVTVYFDAEGLGPKPTEPKKPEEPAEVVPGEDDPADAAAPTNTAPDPKAVHAAALAKYEDDKKKYESDLKAFQTKIKDGEKLVKELNARFAEWYYVVSGNSFENLRQGRKTLVKDKTAQANPAEGASQFPGLPPGLKLPGLQN